ncbi:MAG: SIMPL domain-containing protein [candidate division SR1 bacterium]|nr:SIMPL domain-containing protein [candidate division SR1 bacterium]
MKTIDRIFIVVLVVVVCVSGIYAVKSFTKGREAINVVGEGQVEVQPNEIKIQLNAVYSGAEQEAIEKFNQEVKEIQQQFGSQGRIVKKDDNHFLDKREDYTPRCYARGLEIKAPCLDAYVTLQATGDNLVEKGRRLISAFEDKKSMDIKNIYLSVSNTQEVVNQARELALKDAKEQAISTAKTLGVGLGRLLQTTEYKIDDGYGDQQNSYFYTQHFYGREALNVDSVETLKIIRKAYLTYDID